MEMEKSFEELSKEEHVQLMKQDAEGWVRSLAESLGLRGVTDGVEGPVEGPSDLTVNEVHSVGGREGEGEHAERVYVVTDGVEEYFFFEIVGFYDSYEGTEWDHFFIVEPYEVMVTKYRAV